MFTYHFELHFCFFVILSSLNTDFNIFFRFVLVLACLDHSLRARSQFALFCLLLLFTR